MTFLISLVSHAILGISLTLANSPRTAFEEREYLVSQIKNSIQSVISNPIRWQEPEVKYLMYGSYPCSQVECQDAMIITEITLIGSYSTSPNKFELLQGRFSVSVVRELKDLSLMKSNVTGSAGSTIEFKSPSQTIHVNVKPIIPGFGRETQNGSVLFLRDLLFKASLIQL